MSMPKEKIKHLVYVHPDDSLEGIDKWLAKNHIYEYQIFQMSKEQYLKTKALMCPTKTDDEFWRKGKAFVMALAPFGDEINTDGSGATGGCVN